VSPTKVTGRTEMLPTIVDTCIAEFGEWNKQMLPELDVVWLGTSESTTQSMMAG
jgi:hypothetical protein